jgi:UDP-glucuronate 4-epimerase
MVPARAMRILITGTAGFIGFHLARRLIADGHEITGVDGMTAYYDVALKRARHAILKKHNGFAAYELMLEDLLALEEAVDAAKPEVIIHLAAQAGVRYSLENPRAYVDANVIGAFHVQEMAKRMEVQHLLIASTSSAYGANETIPFHETDKADHPLTLYAATKRAGEAMSHAYAHLHGIPTTVFRFFTVYGPWGRPDMALFKFVEAMANGRPIEVYNGGDMQRDFTFVDDLVEAIARLTGTPPRLGQPVGPFDSLSPVASWRLVNIGAGSPVGLNAFIGEIERVMGRKAERIDLPMQAGDAPRNFADVTLLQALIGYRPTTSVRDGVEAFWAWYKDYRGL